MGIIKTAMGLRASDAVVLDSCQRDCQCLITTVPAVTRQFILIFDPVANKYMTVTVSLTATAKQVSHEVINALYHPTNLTAL